MCSGLDWHAFWVGKRTVGAVSDSDTDSQDSIPLGEALTPPTLEELTELIELLESTEEGFDSDEEGPSPVKEMLPRANSI